MKNQSGRRPDKIIFKNVYNEVKDNKLKIVKICQILRKNWTFVGKLEEDIYALAIYEKKQLSFQLY